MRALVDHRAPSGRGARRGRAGGRAGRGRRRCRARWTVWHRHRVLYWRDVLPPHRPGALPDAHRPRVVRRGELGRRGRGGGLDRSARHRRHDARLRQVPSLPRGPTAPVRHRYEIGIRGGWPGAMAEQLLVPVKALQGLPDSVDRPWARSSSRAGTLLAPVRCAAAPGMRLLVIGAGTIGLLVAFIARTRGSEVHLMGRSAESLEFARSIGLETSGRNETCPRSAWDAVVDASNSPEVPARPSSWSSPAGASYSSAWPARRASSTLARSRSRTWPRWAS